MKLDKITPEKTAVLVVDMQNDFISKEGSMFNRMGHAMVDKLAAFINACRDKGIMIVYIKTNMRKDGKDIGKFADFCQPLKDRKALMKDTIGGEIYSELPVLEEDIIIVKQKYSAFYGTNLDNVLSCNGIDTVVITGVNTEACCLSTARDAGFRNMDVAFISDLTGTIDFPDMGYGAMTDEEMHRATLINIAMTCADVMTSEEFIEKI
ncbi:MAG: cysteine hydrolase [Ruminococcaceae bacterium]|mgnify:CR=1 FL=1|nr:cysteine hydrolase [Oscillospiraceae bacterium]